MHAPFSLSFPVALRATLAVHPMTDHAPRIVRTDTPQGPCAQLLGRWGAAELGTEAQWRAVSGQLQTNAAAPTLGWDLSELQWLDHVGAQLLWNHWQQIGRAHV